MCEDATLQIGFLGWHWGMGRDQVSRSVRRLSGKGVQAAITTNRKAAHKTSVTAGIQYALSAPAKSYSVDSGLRPHLPGLGLLGSPDI